MSLVWRRCSIVLRLLNRSGKHLRSFFISDFVICSFEGIHFKVLAQGFFRTFRVSWRIFMAFSRSFWAVNTKFHCFCDPLHYSLVYNFFTSFFVNHDRFIAGKNGLMLNLQPWMYHIHDYTYVSRANLFRRCPFQFPFHLFMVCKFITFLLVF